MIRKPKQPKPLPVQYGHHPSDETCGVTHIDGGCVIPSSFDWSRRADGRAVLTITPKVRPA